MRRLLLPALVVLGTVLHGCSSDGGSGDGTSGGLVPTGAGGAASGAAGNGGKTAAGGVSGSSGHGGAVPHGGTTIGFPGAGGDAGAAGVSGHGGHAGSTAGAGGATAGQSGLGGSTGGNGGGGAPGAGGAGLGPGAGPGPGMGGAGLGPGAGGGGSSGSSGSGPPGPFCGDHTCDPGESCTSCAGDCGACPVMFGDPFFAISPDQGTFDAAQASTLRALGAGMVRIQVCDWPSSKASVSAMVDTARAAGLHVYAELNYCTLHAQYPDTTSWHAGFTDGGNSFNWAFASAAGDIAASFQGRVEFYEIWNEPDAAPRPKGWDGQGALQYADSSSADWDGACGNQQADGTPGYDYGTPYVPLGASWGLCPKQLGTLTTNAYLAIKGADAGAKVVAGNLLFHGADAWVAKEYWKKVEESGAVTWYRTTKTQGQHPWDIVGVHPYGYAPNDATNDLAAQLSAFQAIAPTYGDGAPSAISEYGWNSVNYTGSDPLAVDEGTQASRLLGTFAVAQQRSLAFVMWFNYLDAPPFQLSFGVRRADQTWKPAAKAYCQAASATACPAP